MKITAEQKFIRITPQKIRQVVRGINHLPPTEALVKLNFLKARSAQVVSKVIKQAMANAVNNFNLNSDLLKIDHIEVNEGSTFKRWQPVSRGRAHSIFKRTSHLKITLVAPDTTPQSLDKAPIAAPSPQSSVSPKSTATKKLSTTKSQTRSKKPKGQ